MKILRFFGGLDIFCWIWLCVISIQKGYIPFYTEMHIALAANERFFDTEFSNWGLWLANSLVILSSISAFSLVLSGVLLLYLRKMGMLISLCHAPLRLLLIMPLSLFFLIPKTPNLIYWILIFIIYGFEVFRSVYIYRARR